MIEQTLVEILIASVALLSLILFFIGILSYRKKNDIRLLSITLAFGIFFMKNLLTAVVFHFDAAGHGDLELFNALSDLLAMIFLLIPVFKKNNITNDDS